MLSWIISFAGLPNRAASHRYLFDDIGSARNAAKFGEFLTQKSRLLPVLRSVRQQQRERGDQIVQRCLSWRHVKADARAGNALRLLLLIGGVGDHNLRNAVGDQRVGGAGAAVMDSG